MNKKVFVVSISVIAMLLFAGLTSLSASDLTPWIDGPHRTCPGEIVKGKIRLAVFNLGKTSAPGTREDRYGYMVDLILSSDRDAPLHFADYADSWFEDVLLARVTRTGMLAPGKSINYNPATIIIPENTPPGAYYLGAVVDPGNTVQEKDKTNNIAWHLLVIEQAKVKRAPYADLTAWINGPVTAVPGRITANPIEIVIINLGSATAVGSRKSKNGYTIEVVLSSDRTLSTIKPQEVDRWTEDMLIPNGRIIDTRRLKAGQIRRFQIPRLAIPGDLKPGTYYLGVVVDARGELREKRLDNNLAWQEINIQTRVSTSTGDIGY